MGEMASGGFSCRGCASGGLAARGPVGWQPEGCLPEVWYFCRVSWHALQSALLFGSCVRLVYGGVRLVTCRVRFRGGHVGNMLGASSWISHGNDL